MDKIKGKNYFILFYTGIIVGGLFGIISYNALVSHRIDEYHQKIKALELLIEDKDLRLEKLEDTIDKNKLIVKNINITLNHKEDDLTRIGLEKNIRETLNKFVGKEVHTVDAEMLWEVVDGRIVKIADKEYKIKLNKLLISETIMVWGDVLEEDNN
ncbi:hypothetical protein N3C_2048 [Clostridium sp. N3C]|uniref:hypothetical protein n=1 Tax=Clostridium sp. N3C TaxID=1776758 RepID=UPI00092DF92D|nr:hypothetical protein [Clostridium sp. N3C]SCN24906.1 hypothetical protein N3C_2048 [Clostridium sp. N3C]